MLIAFCGALLSAWMGLRWTPCWIAAILFAASGLLVSVLVTRPAIEIHKTHLSIGRMAIPWQEIQRIDQTGWQTPLAVFLTLRGDHRILLFYAGEQDSCSSLLGHLRSYCTAALLDGIPYREFWGECTGESARPMARGADSAHDSGEPRQGVPEGTPVRYRLLCPEDEEEVERMFQRLKSVGHLESKNSEEK